MGDDTFDPNEDQMLHMWGESMKDVNCKSALINYDDFVLLMKGQKRERDSKRIRASIDGLSPVPELHAEDDENQPQLITTPLSSFNEKEYSPISARLSHSGGSQVTPPSATKLVGGLLVAEPKKDISPVLSAGSPARGGIPSNKSLIRMGSNSAPATPLHYGKRFDDIEQPDESPLSMDDDENEARVAFNQHPDVFRMPDLDLDLTPPQTPVRGPADYVTPASSRPTLDSQLLSILGPPDLSSSFGKSLHSSLTRGRSVSLDEKERKLSFDAEEEAGRMMEANIRGALTSFKRDSRRAVAIPEHTHNISDIDRVIEDKTKTPLVVNRKLYRAHREFRHAVTDACKRFEDEQMRRAKETLRARENATAKYTAGLVMRHGQALSDESIKTFLKKTMEEQQKQVDKANRRGGRGRRSRKKTISDMSGMLAGSALPAETSPELQQRQTLMHQDDVPKKQEGLTPITENNNLLRNPTKPGVFIKTNYNPFRRKSILYENGNIKSDETPTTRAASSSAAIPSTPPPPLT